MLHEYSKLRRFWEVLLRDSVLPPFPELESGKKNGGRSRRQPRTCYNGNGNGIVERGGCGKAIGGRQKMRHRFEEESSPFTAKCLFRAFQALGSINTRYVFGVAQLKG